MKSLNSIVAATLLGASLLAGAVRADEVSVPDPFIGCIGHSITDDNGAMSGALADAGDVNLLGQTSESPARR